MEFYRFCICTAEEYATLRECVDRCGAVGRSYEFGECGMPAGCAPGRLRLGFWKCGGDYWLYMRPEVSYNGSSRALRDFFARGSTQRFRSFDALTQRLSALKTDTAVLGSAGGGMGALFRRLQLELGSQVLGQDRAVEAVAFKLSAHICKRTPRRPLSLIFYGPSGVGKSELGKSVHGSLNRCLGSERYRLVWTELNTFTEAHSVYRLTGAPPGYIGYDDAPVLEVVRECPHTVFMFDELDKAHPEVLKVFMSILDEGRCTARRADEQLGRELDFRRCVFLFTTNTDLSGRARPLGFSAPEQDADVVLTAGGAGRCENTPAISEQDLALRLFQDDECARAELARSGVLREIAGRFSGLIGFGQLSEQSRADVTARQIISLGREYGLQIARVSPLLAQELTPRQALSLRSGVPVLEGLLGPVFLSAAPLAHSGAPLKLEGTVESMQLLPA